MIVRQASAQIQTLAKWYPVLAVTGPRQSGKTTLVRTAFPDKPYLSLEDPDTRATAAQDPRRFLGQHPQGAIIDEVQRVPELFSYLQGLVDEARFHGGDMAGAARWVLTGSQQFGLLGGITQSLAGRVGLLELMPLSLGELLAAGAIPAARTAEAMLWRGFYPSPALGKVPPGVWYADYFATYVERDVRQILQIKDLNAFRIFVRMAAARVAQVLNLSALAADCGISTNTAKAWLSILETSYLCTTLQPHHRNFGKQLTKAPKLYFLDTGLVAWLTGLRTAQEVGASSMRGALFENWAVTEAFKYKYNLRQDVQFSYWRNKTGHEIDLLIDDGSDQVQAIEIKAGQTVAGDWFRNLLLYAKLNPDVQSHVLYGGKEGHSRHGIACMGWRDWPGFLEAQKKSIVDAS